MKQITRTLAAVAFVTAAGITPAQASGPNPTELAEAFATCAGRLEALATRQGALDDPRSEATRRRYQQ